MEGWVKLHRKIATWQWATSPGHMTTFMQLLLRANHKATKWRMETILPGQLLTGRKQLMDWTGLTERQIRKCLDDLELTGEIRRKRAAKYSIISIANWETYQSDDRETSGRRPADVQQTSTSKNVNNEKNEKNILSSEAFTGDRLGTIEEIEVSQDARTIITMLNALCFKNFRPTKAHVAFINARLNEGYQLEDFKAVIQHKQDKWANDPKFSAYLRPSTLFGTKFDGYLQDARAPFKTNFKKASGSDVTPEDLERARQLGIL